MARVRQDEVLGRVPGDTEVVPRYDLINQNGQIVQSNVEMRLKNPIVQEGTLVDKVAIEECLAASGQVTGTSSAVVLVQENFSLFDLAPIIFTAPFAIMPAATLNINNTGAKKLKLATGNDLAGSLPANVPVYCLYSRKLDAYVVQTMDAATFYQLDAITSNMYMNTLHDIYKDNAQATAESFGKTQAMFLDGFVNNTATDTAHTTARVAPASTGGNVLYESNVTSEVVLPVASTGEIVAAAMVNTQTSFSNGGTDVFSGTHRWTGGHASSRGYGWKFHANLSQPMLIQNLHLTGHAGNYNVSVLSYLAVQDIHDKWFVLRNYAYDSSKYPPGGLAYDRPIDTYVSINCGIIKAIEMAVWARNPAGEGNFESNLAARATVLSFSEKHFRSLAYDGSVYSAARVLLTADKAFVQSSDSKVALITDAGRSVLTRKQQVAADADYFDITYEGTVPAGSQLQLDIATAAYLDGAAVAVPRVHRYGCFLRR